MREDLNKSMCEGPRQGHTWHYDNVRVNRYLDAKYDDMYEDDEVGNYATGGARESMTHRHNVAWNRKSFGENLAPLYGNIRKAVGRKWDDFFSELNSVFDTRSVINRHILLHLYDRIEVDNVFVDDTGQLMVRTKYGQRVEPLNETSTEYYVDPRDGIIKINAHAVTWREQRRARAAERQAEKDKILRVIDNETELHNIEGVWFEVKFKNHKQYPQVSTRLTKMFPSSTDTGTRATIPYTRYVYPDTYDVLQKMKVSAAKVAVKKRTLNHKELKKHGLI